MFLYRDYDTKSEVHMLVSWTPVSAYVAVEGQSRWNSAAAFAVGYVVESQDTGCGLRGQRVVLMVILVDEWC